MLVSLRCFLMAGPHDQSLNMGVDLSLIADINLDQMQFSSNYYDIEQLLQAYSMHKPFQYNCLHINIHSIPDKYDQLVRMLLDLKAYNIQVHFIMLCETFLTDKAVAKCKIPGYELIYENRKTLTKGGVALYVSDMFTAKKLPDVGVHVEGEFETVFAEVKDGDKSMIVGEIYRIPQTNEKLSLERFNITLSNIQKFNPSSIIIGTDQNFDYMNVNTNNNILTLLNTFVTCGMLPTINKPTRITHTSATCIDNIYIKSSKLNQLFSAILLSDISDHLPVMTCYGTWQRKTKSPLIFSHRPLNDQTLCAINNELKQTNWSYLYDSPVNEAYNNFVIKLNETLDKYAPVQTVSIPPNHIIEQQWMTKGLLKSCKKRDKLFRQSLGRPKHHSSHIKYIKYRNMLNALKRKAKENHYKDLLHQFSGDIKKNLANNKLINWAYE